MSHKCNHTACGPFRSGFVLLAEPIWASSMPLWVSVVRSVFLLSGIPTQVCISLNKGNVSLSRLCISRKQVSRRKQRLCRDYRTKVSRLFFLINYGRGPEENTPKTLIAVVFMNNFSFFKFVFVWFLQRALIIFFIIEKHDTMIRMWRYPGDITWRNGNMWFPFDLGDIKSS